MNTNLPISFALKGIETIEFATIKEVFCDNKPIGFSLNPGFAIKSLDLADLRCSVEFYFTQEEIPFIKIKVACFFEIEEKAWHSVYDKEYKRIVFPKGFADHLLVLTIGTLRGVLHAKTEGTIFNRFFVPTINVGEISNDDLIIEIGD